MSNFITENKDGYSIVSMSAERLDNQSTAELRSVLVLIAGNGVKNIILDLTPCHYCDTAGLSAILIAHRLCKDGVLILSGVSQEVQQMLSIQRFDPELVIEPDIATAEGRMSSLLGSK